METVNRHVMLSGGNGSACQAEGCPWQWPFKQDQQTVFDPGSQIRLDFARHVTEALMAVIQGQAEYGVAIRVDGRRSWVYPRDGQQSTRLEAEQELHSPSVTEHYEGKLVWRQAAGPWQEVTR